MPANNNPLPRSSQEQELQEMLGYPPGWILRSGITLVFGVITIALMLSWLIRYPDKLSARMTIIQSVPPHEIRPLISARIDTIFLADGTEVSIGEKIAILESATNWQDVEKIEHLLQLYDLGDHLPWPKNLILGNLQSQYATFLEALSDLNFYNDRTIFEERKEAAKNEITSLQELEDAYSMQRQYFLKEKTLIQKNLNRTETLYKEGVSSTIELEEQEKQVLQYEQKLKNIDITLLQNQLRIKQLKAQLSENKDEYQRNKNSLELKLSQAKRTLKGSIEEWYNQHVLTSPISGKLEWNRSINNYYTVVAGNLLGMVVPQNDDDHAVAQLYVAVNGIGKIALNAPVRISLDAYPEHEFGKIFAQVDEISLAPTNYNNTNPEYILKVNLPDALKTTYGKDLVLKPNMSGKAVIITKDRRILERIFQQFMNVLKNN